MSWIKNTEMATHRVWREKGCYTLKLKNIFKFNFVAFTWSGRNAMSVKERNKKYNNKLNWKWEKSNGPLCLQMPPRVAQANRLHSRCVFHLKGRGIASIWGVNLQMSGYQEKWWKAARQLQQLDGISTRILCFLRSRHSALLISGAILLVVTVCITENWVTKSLFKRGESGRFKLDLFILDRNR